MSGGSTKFGAILAVIVIMGLYIVSNIAMPQQPALQCPACPRCPDLHCPECPAQTLRQDREPPVKCPEVKCPKAAPCETSTDDPEWNLEDFLTNIPEQHRDKCRKFLKDGSDASMYSQFRQDWFIYNNYFRHNNGRAFGEGFYVDVGANDPNSLSNTVFFDRCLGWKGICVEPNPIYAPGYTKHRTCELIPNCVYRERKTLLFDLPNTGSKGTGGRILNCTEVEPCNETRIGAIKKVLCLTLEEILANVSHHIDLLSVDVEGNELDVLETFPFEKHDIKIVTIEMNKVRIASLSLSLSIYVPLSITLCLPVTTHPTAVPPEQDGLRHERGRVLQGRLRWYRRCLRQAAATHARLVRLGVRRAVHVAVPSVIRSTYPLSSLGVGIG